VNRSRSQTMVAFLPDAVFRHEQRLRARVAAVEGTRVVQLNEEVVYEEIARYAERWDEPARARLPLPRGRATQNFTLVSPDLIYFDVFPLVLECARHSCRRVHTFRTPRQLAAASTCRHCNSRLQQLPYYSAHQCGRVERMYVPKCDLEGHGWDHIVFEDTGSFVTATWRCVGAGCGGRKVRGTAQSPCSCEWKDAGGVARMRAHTLSDTRAYRIHSLDLVNIDNTEFRQYQKHPERGRIAAAHYLGLISSLAEGLGELTRATGTSGGVAQRLTALEWQAREQQLRASGMDEAFIAQVREAIAPAQGGLAALSDATVDTHRWEQLGAYRPFVERAAVFDPAHVPRITLREQHDSCIERGDQQTGQTTALALQQAESLGIEEIAVTWEFPIAKVAFGFTREKHDPNEAKLTGFHHREFNGGKYPVYAASSDTEALLVTFSAPAVLSYLCARGLVPHGYEDVSSARRRVLEIFTEEDGAEAEAAAVIRTVVHTLGHLLLRALDDGQVGLAENTLAEWQVPEALTVAIYANNVREFTLGSLWTLLSNRVLSWLESATDTVLSCENDPLCHQSSPRCCERCLYLTFGCQLFNEDLDRAVAADFLRHVSQRGGAGTGQP